jgi:hypothetical protein
MEQVEEDRIAALEAQLKRILTYVGTPNGQLFATEQRVNALERLVLQQQTQLNEYQQRLQVQQDIIAQQFQVKGKTPEFTMLTKFVAGHTTDVLNKLQTANRQLMQEFFQNAAPSSLSPSRQITHVHTHTMDAQVHSLASRIALLESQQSSTHQPLPQQPHTVLTNIIPETQRAEIQQLKEHIRHVENELITQINLQYTGPNKQQPVVNTMKSLQKDFDAIKQEIQSIRLRQHERVSQEEIYNVLLIQIKNYADHVQTQLQTQMLSGFAECAKSEDVKQQTHTLSQHCTSVINALHSSLVQQNIRITQGLDTLNTRLDELPYAEQIRELEHQTTTELTSITSRITRLEMLFTTRLQRVLQAFENPSVLHKKAELTALLDSARVEIPAPTQQQKTATQQITVNDLRYQGLTKCFYTAVYTDGIHPPDTLGTGEKIPGWDYICFTNCPSLTSSVWDIIHIDGTQKTPVLNAKSYKWGSATFDELRDYDVVVWVDAYIFPMARSADRLKQVIVDMWNQNHMILHRPHKDRQCVWQECDAVLASKRDIPGHVSAVKRLLESMNMPRNWGLFDSNIMIKFHKYEVLQQISQYILVQLTTLSPRDQLAITPMYYTHKFKSLIVKDILDMFGKIGTHERHPAF